MIIAHIVKKCKVRFTGQLDLIKSEGGNVHVNLLTLGMNPAVKFS